MCGRYTLATPDLGQLRARWPLPESLQIQRRYNVAPGDDVLAVVQRRDDAAPEGTLLRWGLVPFWASDPKEVAAKTINARAETVAERPAYRDAFERRRCLIVADGFFEWSGGVPHWITREDGAPFAFAGLWASWRPQGASREVEPLRSCAIVTTAAAGPVRALHDRMPVILPGRRCRGRVARPGHPGRRAARAARPRRPAGARLPAGQPQRQRRAPRRAGLPRPARAGVAVLSCSSFDE